MLLEVGGEESDMSEGCVRIKSERSHMERGRKEQGKERGEEVVV